jgi:hypothetical protein
MGLRDSLEGLIRKYLPVTAVTTLDTPIHEGLHAGLAKLLPNVSSRGIVLDSGDWYTSPLQYATFGFVRAQDLPDTVGGYAITAVEDNMIGHLSGAVVSAGPEVATMTLGLYWIKRSLDSFKSAGEKVYSTVHALAGMSLCSHSFHYLRASVSDPHEGMDHVNFTGHLLEAFHLPGGLAGLLTFAGATGMVAAAVYLAGKIPGYEKDDDRNLMAAMLPSRAKGTETSQ